MKTFGITTGFVSSFIPVLSHPCSSHSAFTTTSTVIPIPNPVPISHRSRFSTSPSTPLPCSSPFPIPITAAKSSSSSSSSSSSPSSQTRTFNINLAVKKYAEGLAFADIAASDLTVLQGMSQAKAAPLVEKFHLTSVRKLADWKYAAWAHAIVTLEPLEEKGKRDTKSAMTALDHIVDKEYEAKSLREIMMAPVSALQGISEEGGQELAKVGIKTVKNLGNWKFYKWAKAIVLLADKE